MRRKLVSFVVAILVAGFASNAAAAPIELENDADISWANNPNCILIPALCEPLIIGAPRLVPNMSSAGDLLLFTFDFHDVSVIDFIGPSVLTLNIGDAAGNEVFRPGGGSTPLRLTYTIPLSGDNPNGAGSLPAQDLTVNLGSFVDFGLLPAGDLLFSVTLDLRLDLPLGGVFRAGDGRTQAATLIITGPGAPLQVPEPGALALVLTGLAGAGLGARWRRPRSERQDA